MVRRLNRSMLLTVLMPVLLLASEAEAQRYPVLRGQIMDAQTQSPIFGVFVSFVDSGRGVFTDSLGFFSLPPDSDPPYGISIAQLGYHPMEGQLALEDVGKPIMVSLAPDPIQIEGLTILADRMAGRRVGPYGSGDVLDQAELLASPDGSGYDLVVRMLPFVQPCGMESEALCAGGRTSMGGPRQITVCVDGQKIQPQFTETALQRVQPQGLYMVEIFSRAGEVRMYSQAYLKRLMDAGMSLPPLSFGCGGISGE
jgi:hypothetical protein